jgi:hypothetical protein
MSKNYKTRKKASRLGFGAKSAKPAPVLVRNCAICRGTHELGKCPEAKW